MRNTIPINLSYILLLVVMGGRTALFVSKLDAILPFNQALGIPLDLTPLSLFLALALILAVPGCAWWRGRAVRGSMSRNVATGAMMLAAFIDGWLNVSEAVYLATQRGVFSEFTGFVLGWMWATVVMVGVGPTILTVLLAWLVGEQTKEAAQQAASGRKAVEYNRTMEEHLRTVVEQSPSGGRFTRANVQDWTKLGKQQSNNVIRYGLGRGILIENGRRGSYAVQEKERET